MTNSTHTVEETVIPIQADRDRAAEIVDWHIGTGWEPQFFHPALADGMREGKWDDHPLVQMCARHRLASPSTPAGEDVEQPYEGDDVNLAAEEYAYSPNTPWTQPGIGGHTAVDPEAAFKAGARWQAARASTHDELVEALREAHTVIAVSIAFLGRDRGTDRQEKMLDGLTDELVAADKMILAALTKMGEKL